jgi:TrmH family RNA methyltransferase
VRRISSRQNPSVRRFRELARTGSADGRLLIDGVHLLEEALASGVPIESAAFLDPAPTRHLSALADRTAAAGAQTFAVTAGVLSAMSPVKQPSGVVAIGLRRPASAGDVLTQSPRRPPLVPIIADVQDPGNVGAIVRAAEACGATGVIAGEGSADPFGWKAVRGSMGSIFRLPVAVKQPLPESIRLARRAGLRVFAAVPRDGTPLADCRLNAPVAILLGGEGAGVSDEAIGLADERLTIPMQPPVESLNVAVAAALILYEAFRQRR